MSWTLCTSGPTIKKAGLNANSTIISYATNKATLDKWSDEAEGWVEQITNTSWVVNSATLSTSIAAALSDVVSSKIAMNIIAYDSTGYLSREADMLMNWNDDIITKGISALKGKPDTLKAP